MIPATDTIVQIDELPGEEIEFGIGDPRWVMRNNADLYGNRELAVAREYSTNAADAHVEHGVTRPIEVTLPSTLNPYFIVRDFGEGMDLETLTEVYTQFGISTKRKTNNQNGMLGYGSKVGVAYTNTFTVTSIHQGIKRVAVINRKPDWAIVMKIVATSKTDEPSGTEIKVPVHNPEEFATKAKKFYKFWQPGLVLVNGVEPVHEVGRKIVDGLYASNQYGTSYIVMGNVPYKIENPEALFRHSKMRHFHFVAYVNNGDVEFPPNREGLKYTEKTKKALHNIFNQLEASVIKAAADEIAAAKTPAEAFQIWIDWRNNVGFGLFDDLTYKGKKLEESFLVNGYSRTISRYGRLGYSTVRQYSVMEMPNTIVVTNFLIEPSAHAKNKVQEYVNLMGWQGITKILFITGDGSAITSDWIPRDKFVSWDALKAALPKKQRQANQNTGRPTGSWDFFQFNKGHVTAEYAKPIPAGFDLYYCTVQETKARTHPRYIMERLGIKNGVLIIVPQNRKAKFLRDYPKVKSLRKVAESKVVEDGESLLCDEAKEVLSLGYYTREAIKRLDVTKVDDPDYAKFKDLVKREDALLKKYQDNLTLANSLNLRYHVKEHKIQSSNEFHEQRYPLVRDFRYGRPINEDTYIYMNAKYKVLADRKKQ